VSHAAHFTSHDLKGVREVENQLVVFNLANEDYGVDIAAVDGIVKMQSITKVPRAPSFVEGITNLRGEVLPVIDLRKRFGLPLGEVTKDTRIVNVDIDSTKVGMIVDAVSEVLRVSEEDVEPPSPLVTTVDSSFITGIAKLDERLIILLDLAQVLSTEEQADLQSLRQNRGDTLPAGT
jgi:purine-binding chemotaxis protein CheW